MINISEKKKMEEISEAIKFYEKNLPENILNECRIAEGTEYYPEILVRKYKEYSHFRSRK